MSRADGFQAGAAEFVVLDSGCFFGMESAEALQVRPECFVLDQYKLAETDLAPYPCLVIDAFADQEWLYRQRDLIRRFLDQGKLLIFCGHLFRDWLPGGSLFVPRTIRSHLDYTVLFHKPHPIFTGLTSEELTYNKGVAGFFARGHNPPPPGAEVLLTLPGGEGITYIDRMSTGGTILAHAGNSLFTYGPPESKPERIGSQLRAWARAEIGRIGRKEGHG
ncbi:phosphate starvation-inducible protein PhoH [Paenibacillus validus]|uniref:phosphate starvation-inducible protein PhoH n=1 Tax=Paenibacillus validus TaxID=44253 RepID=UPI003D2D91FD